MKIAALDMGDAWTGVALTDAAGILAKPYTTVTTGELIPFLRQLLTAENIMTCIVGYPKTMRATESAQTKKVIAFVETLKKQFPSVAWVLWDERLSSKRAQSLQKSTSKEDKKKSHAVAAAFILHSYLEFQLQQNKTD